MDSFFKKSYFLPKPVVDKPPKRASSDLASPSQLLTIAIAISGSAKSNNVLKWALKKFGSDKNSVFRLIHIHPKLTTLITPSGDTVPISEVPEDVASTYRLEVMQATKETLLKPYRKMCERKKVAVELQVIESNNVAVAISKDVKQHLISNLVIGRSSDSALVWHSSITEKISRLVTNVCTVYVVSKGVYILSKDNSSPDIDRNESLRDSCNDRTDSSSCSSGSGPHSDAISMISNPHAQSKKSLQRYPSIMVQMETSSADSEETRSIASDAPEEVSMRISPETSRTISWNPRLRDFDERKDAMSSMSTSSNREYENNTQGGGYFADNEEELKEIKKLREELKHAHEMYAEAQVETLDASRKINELKFEELKLKEHKTKVLAEKERHKLEQMRRKEKEELKLKLKEHKTKVLAEKETHKLEHMRREEKEELKLKLKEHETMVLAEKETHKFGQMRREEKEAEMKATRESTEKEKLAESSLVSPKLQYQVFTWEEITTATSSFSEDLKIGMGAYGAVYKCNLHHTIAAVKVLHSAESSLSKQFDQEVEILSKISHPHLVLLLGACPERGALVYEYMENGSLEDRLFQVNNTQPIPWFVRFRIAWEVASALLFLHKSKPKPIIHRDLKPANVLLDRNFVSKLGDVGLSTMIQVDPLLTQFTMYKQTSPVGTLCYIDPEYQRTGRISPKSDVYALGMIILQLLTAQPAMALTYTVEIAMEENNDDELIQILDQKAGTWPIEETRKLAALALSCTELRAKDRPDLEDKILPTLESLKKVADKAKNSLSVVRIQPPTEPPSHFLCPLLKEVMKDPCIASDGYTYDRRAIEGWMEKHRTSPVTNSPLQNLILLPNHTLYSAILEWRKRNQ